MKTLARYSLIVALAICLDQFVKYLVETKLNLQEQVDILPFIALYRTYNTGVAFSMFSSFGDTGLIVVSLAVTGFVLYLASRTPSDQPVARFGFALIIGGAVGNLADRAIHGHVIDYVLFHTSFWSFAVFNLADALITVGAVLVVTEEVLGWWKQRKADRPSTD